jgi:Leucine-rich repeat (LRR) protein
MKRKLFVGLLFLVFLSFVLPQGSIYAGLELKNVEKASKLERIGFLPIGTNKFILDEKPTRIEAAIMMIRLLGQENVAKKLKHKHPFTDVPSWANSYIGYLYVNKYSSGISKKLYGSSKNITLNQYVTFVLRALGYNDTYGDFKSNESLKKAVEIGLLSSGESSYYAEKGSFIKDDFVGITINALSTCIKGKKATLINKLVNEGVIDRKAATEAGLLEDTEKVIFIKDKNLEAVVKGALSIDEGEIHASDIYNLVELKAENKGISSLDGLENFKNLRVLYLNYNKISDLKPLEELTNLNTLYISDNEIKDLEAIVRLTNLKNLYIPRNQITSIKPLENLNGLKLLFVDNNSITDISPISNLTNMETLSLMSLNLTDIKPVEELNKLIFLNLQINKISDLSPLASLSNLRELYLTFNNISDISKIGNLKNMMDLRLGGNSISNISCLSSMIELAKLNLSQNKISNISSLSSLNKLKELYLENNPISDFSPVKGIYNQLEKKDFIIN